MWGHGFEQVEKRNLLLVHDILEVAAKTAHESHDREVLGTFYQACVDQGRTKLSGEMSDLLTRIWSIEDQDALLDLVAELHGLGIGAVFGAVPIPSPRGGGRVVLALTSGATALPQLDYLASERMALRRAYVEHVARTFRMAGLSTETARTRAKLVLSFEQELVRVDPLALSKSRGDFGARAFTTLGELSEHMPGFGWERYGEARGLRPGTPVVLSSPRSIEALPGLLAERGVEAARAYLAWSLLDGLAVDLPLDYLLAHIEFDSGVRLDQQVGRHIVAWKRCSSRAQALLPELVGRYFYELQSDRFERETAYAMIMSLHRAFAEKLETASWMDAATRAEAQLKLSSMRHLVAGPTRWLDHGGVELGGDHLANAMKLRQLHVSSQLSGLEALPDLESFPTSPAAVNAFYAPLKNATYVTAGALEWPLFDAAFPVPFSFGRLGAILGHEIGHAFDATGRHMDAQGAWRNWWSSDSAAQYERRASCFVAHYEGYSGLEGTPVDGVRTLTENMADVVGIRMAFSAYRDWMLEHEPSAAPHVPPLANEQLFFVSYAQLWCDPTERAWERMAGENDPHAPPNVRVNAALALVPEFAEAWGCSPQSSMVAEPVCELW